MSVLTIKSIECKCDAGGDINEALREAIALAIKSNNKVVFNHSISQVSIEVDPRSILHALKMWNKIVV